MTHILLDIALYVTNSVSVIRHSRIADLSGIICLEHMLVYFQYVK